jgi:hypothetical protein
VIPWRENDALFKAELEAGHEAELAVALALLREGLAVQVPVLKIRADRSEIPEYADQADLLILHGATVQRVEVKSRALEFGADPASYPYPTALVDTKEGWQQKGRHPVAVVLVSQPTRHGMPGARLVVPVSSEPQWVEATVHDRVRDIDLVVLAAPRSCLRRWEEFVGWLKRG